MKRLNSHTLCNCQRTHEHRQSRSVAASPSYKCSLSVMPLVQPQQSSMASMQSVSQLVSLVSTTLRTASPLWRLHQMHTVTWKSPSIMLKQTSLVGHPEEGPRGKGYSCSSVLLPLHKFCGVPAARYAHARLPAQL